MNTPRRHSEGNASPFRVTLLRALAAVDEGDDLRALELLRRLVAEHADKEQPEPPTYRAGGVA